MKWWLVFSILAVSFISAHGQFKVCVFGDSQKDCSSLAYSSSDKVKCVPVEDTVECALKLQRNEADFGVFPFEEALVANFFIEQNVQVISEIRDIERKNEPYAFEAVALVKNSYNGGLAGLKGKGYCHPGLGTSRYFTPRVLKHFERKVIETSEDISKKCYSWKSAQESEIEKLADFFGPSCRPGQWIIDGYVDKKEKVNNIKLCALCDDRKACEYDKEKGNQVSAIQCLSRKGGDVAYVSLSAVIKYFDLKNEGYLMQESSADYKYLCPDGSVQDIVKLNGTGVKQPCTWLRQPWKSVIARTSSSTEMLKSIKEWMPTTGISPKRGDWTDTLKTLLVGEDEVVFSHFSEPLTLPGFIKKGREIPEFGKYSTCLPNIHWCTSNSNETKKCEWIRAAALTHGILPEITCKEAADTLNCLNLTRHSQTDLTYINSVNGYIARQAHKLDNSMYVESPRDGNYLGIILLKPESRVNNVIDLKGKKACFPRYNGLGWMTFIRAAKNGSAIPTNICPETKEVWKFFSKACAPGAKQDEINPYSKNTPETLCVQCDPSSNLTRKTGAKSDVLEHCKWNQDYKFSGEVGALRCLKWNYGDVAFVNYNEIKKFFDKDADLKDPTDQHIKAEDFKILCRGNRIIQFPKDKLDEDCAIMEVVGGEIVTRKDNPIEKNLDIQLALQDLDFWFGSYLKSKDTSLSLFRPFDGTPGVIFRENSVELNSPSTAQSKPVKDYQEVLVKVEKYCVKAGADKIAYSTVLPTILMIVLVYFFRQ